MTDARATPTDRLLAELDAVGAAYNLPPGTRTGRLLIEAAKEIRALRAVLTPADEGSGRHGGRWPSSIAPRKSTRAGIR